MRFWQAALAVASTTMGLVSAQAGQPSPCAVGCVNGVFGNAASIGCGNGDNVCVCSSTESFNDGIRDCISEACGTESVDVQIPLAQAFASNICATVVPTLASSTAAPTSTPSSTQAVSITSTTASVSSSVSSSISAATLASTVSSSQTTALSSTAASASTSVPTTFATSTTPVVSNTVTSSSSSSSVLAAVQSSSTASVSTSTHPSSTASKVPHPSATEGASTSSTNGLTTAAKAGIGAGIGAVALAAIIIAFCVLFRRRQNKEPVSKARAYKISEPIMQTMEEAGQHYGGGISRPENTLPKPIITTQTANLPSTAQPPSPTSVYSDSSELESHARRYEDMLPRTQPKVLI